MKRRNFIKNTALSSAGIAVGSALVACAENTSEKTKEAPIVTGTLPLVIATWDVKNATAKAWETLQNGGSVLDAIE